MRFVSNLRRSLYAFLIIALLVCCDLFSKTFVKHWLSSGSEKIFHVNSFADIVYFWNVGVGLGMFSAVPSWLLSLLSFAVILLLTVLLLNGGGRNVKLFWGLSFMIGGAIGNLLDRILYGAVFDFIRIGYEGRFFPVFNLADCCVCVGMFFLLLSDLSFDKRGAYV